MGAAACVTSLQVVVLRVVSDNCDVDSIRSDPDAEKRRPPSAPAPRACARVSAGALILHYYKNTCV